VLQQLAHVTHMESVRILMLPSNVPAKLDMLVMVSLAPTSTNVLKPMPVMQMPLVTILLVLMSVLAT